MAMEAFRRYYFSIGKPKEGITLSLLGGTLLFLFAGIAWVVTIKSMDPYFIMAPWRTWGGPLQQGGLERVDRSIHGTGIANVSSDSEPQQAQAGDEDDVGDGYFIQQTGIRGKKAVDRFRAHVACLSDSGYWLYNQVPRKLPWLAVRDFRWVTACDRQHVRHTGGIMGEKADTIALSNGTIGADWLVREELKWVWRNNDSSCPWHPLDRDDFCRRIGAQRNILVVGDSINHEISVALQNVLSMNGSSTVTREYWPSEEMCTDILPMEGDGKGGFRVHFVRNDYLSLVTNETHVGRNFQDPWLPTLERESIKILVLNRGAHYQDDRSLAQGLRQTFTFLQERYPNLLVIYRDTPPGHVNCTQFKQPIAGPLKGDLPSFHWDDFDRQNELAKNLVEEFHFIYIHVARAIGMRPDGHMNDHDCLHYCQPGPLDLAVEMIYNVFLLL